MGKDAGIKGGMFAFALGSFSSGPLYASFPVAMVFLKKGVSLTNIFIFLGAWSTTKIPMMLFEITQLGSKFALIRFGLNLVAIILLAAIMEKTTSKRDAETMYELAKDNWYKPIFFCGIGNKSIDEFEKAGNEVHNFFLEFSEDGQFTDLHSRL